MKKTLIALMALAGVASAELTLDKTLTTGGTYTWDNEAYVTSAAVTLIFSSTAMDKLDTENGWNEAFASFVLSGGTQNQITVEHSTYSDNSEIRVSNTVLGVSWGGSRMTAFSNADYRNNGAWDTAKYAALTFAVDSTGKTESVFSVISATGDITTFGTAKVETGWTFNSISSAAINKNTNPVFVDKAFVYSGEWTTTDLTAVTNSNLTALIPEPATATLSLLALAGLAARRRRK